MNRIDKKLKEEGKLLSIYFTAGFPNLNDTADIIIKLQESGVDMIEIGLPFSDPLADGPTIQDSSMSAINNGMNTDILFNQLKDIRDRVSIPLIIMGYFNPILQYGVEKFCKKCNEIGIDGLIIPDLPIDYYLENYKSIFEQNKLYNMFLIAPQTSDERIRKIDSISKGFIYMVSSSSITGSKNSFSSEQINYFERIEKMDLNTPRIIGFGVGNKETFNATVDYSKGAIIGSAFIKNLHENGIDSIDSFIKSIR
jgi:tryptophan synthase alpha chain|tara:strand:- start:1267 stop:2028 length:762 start_codon:yes stop_codon:yes gene_type:complete